MTLAFILIKDSVLTNYSGSRVLGRCGGVIRSTNAVRLAKGSSLRKRGRGKVSSCAKACATSCTGFSNARCLFKKASVGERTNGRLSVSYALRVARNATGMF